MQNCLINFTYYDFSEECIKNLYTTDDYKRLSFQVADIVTDSNHGQIIEINKIFVDRSVRKQGFGSKALKTVCEGKDNVIIIAALGALEDEYPEEPTDEQYDALFEGLNIFYTKNNFIDVTELYGTYDGSTKKTYLYMNPAGTAAVEKRKAWLSEQE